MYIGREEQSSMQNLHLLSTLSNITRTAPKGTYNTPISKKDTFLSPHNSRTIISLDPSSSLPTDGSTEALLPLPAKDVSLLGLVQSQNSHP